MKTANEYIKTFRGLVVLPKYSWPDIALRLLVIAALFAFPSFVQDPYVLHLMILLFLSTIQGESWNIVGGYAGQYSVGHAAYFGVGAYTTMILLQYQQVPPWIGSWVGVLLVIGVALGIGSICFRLRGPYFVLASIAVAEIIRLSAINLKEITNGAEGILVTEVPPLKIAGYTIFDFASKVPFYYSGLGLALLTIAVTYIVQHSKIGYYLQAIREDQDAAHSLGVNLTRYKKLALVISAMFTALAGSFYAVYIGFIDPPTVLSLDMSVQIVLVCIIGGIGTIWGPVVGAIVLVGLSETLRSNLLTQWLFKLGWVDPQSATGNFLTEHLSHAHVLIYGLLVVIVILFMPEGVLGYVRKLLQKRKAVIQ